MDFLKKFGTRSRRNAYLDVAQRMFKLDGFSSDPDDKKDSGEE
jgi:hypothetical protein